jgi:hypothetical protein
MKVSGGRVVKDAVVHTTGDTVLTKGAVAFYTILQQPTCLVITEMKPELLYSAHIHLKHAYGSGIYI